MLLLLMLSSGVVMTQLFFYFCCCTPFRIPRNKYKPIWPQQQQHIIVLFVMIVVCRNFWLLVNIILQTMPPRRAQGKDVNLRVVYAASAMGMCKGDISKFCKIFFHEQRYLAQSCISYSTLSTGATAMHEVMARAGLAGWAEAHTRKESSRKDSG